MTTATDLIRDLEAIDAKLSLRLVVEAPAGTIDEDMAAEIVEHTPEILVRLALGAQRMGMVATRADDGRPTETADGA